MLWHDGSCPSVLEEQIGIKRVGNRVGKDRIVRMRECCWVFVFSVSLVEKPLSPMQAGQIFPLIPSPSSLLRCSSRGDGK